MAGIEHRDFSAPDEVRSPDKTSVEVVNVGDGQIARCTFQPGWKWSDCVKPVVGTDTCQAEHIGYQISGRIHVEHADGTTADIVPGEVYRIAPGHNAWVLGNEPAVGVEFQSAAVYAKAKA